MFDTAQLCIEFQSYVSDSANDKGIYLNTTIAPNGKPYDGICTQFEPCEARFAFPCFDEPAMRAEFKVCLCLLSELIFFFE